MLQEPRERAECLAPAAGVRDTSRAGPTEIDTFLLVNAALFVAMCVTTYYDRWVTYMGPGSLAEFVFYAAVILAALAALRALLPRRRYPGRVLVLVQAGILLHFAGAYVHVDGVRLYDHALLGLRYDKYVHFANALIGCVGVLAVCRMTGVPTRPMTRVLTFFTVLGLGAVIELAEYVVTRTVPGNGVGGYENTMGDLASNLAGGLTFLALPWRLTDVQVPTDDGVVAGDGRTEDAA